MIVFLEYLIGFAILNGIKLTDAILADRARLLVRPKMGQGIKVDRGTSVASIPIAFPIHPAYDADHL